MRGQRLVRDVIEGKKDGKRPKVGREGSDGFD